MRFSAWLTLGSKSQRCKNWFWLLWWFFYEMHWHSMKFWWRFWSWFWTSFFCFRCFFSLAFQVLMRTPWTWTGTPPSFGRWFWIPRSKTRPFVGWLDFPHSSQDLGAFNFLIMYDNVWYICFSCRTSWRYWATVVTILVPWFGHRHPGDALTKRRCDPLGHHGRPHWSLLVPGNSSWNNMLGAGMAPKTQSTLKNWTTKQ